MKFTMPKYYLLLVILLITGCGQRTDLAPVVELKWQPQNSHQSAHVVKRGETLYAVAFRYDKDFRALAAYNNLRSPYSLRVGQVIRLNNSSYAGSRPHYYQNPRPRPKTWQRPSKTIYTVQTSPKKWAAPARPYGVWQWPAQGRVAANFIPQQGKKGIDIAGKKGEVVRASANGVVAYAGSGLSGYGNLIIIKHDGQFLTAYGNNQRNRVSEGQRVKAGQVIADMGVIDRKFWGVHFEIRRSGQPVNPMNYLQKG